MHKGDGVSTILGDADSGGGESLNGRKNMVRREVKRRALGTMSYQTSYKRSPPFWLLIGQEKHKSFLAPISSHNGCDRLELVW